MTNTGNESIKHIPPRERLIFALDVSSRDEALALVERLGDSVQFYKLGLELFMSPGYFELIDRLVQRGKKVFVDLKFFDIPETVQRAVSRLKHLGVTFTTVHPTNDALLKAVVAEKGEMKILVVTVLTSLSESDLRDLGFQADIGQVVVSRAKRALALGCDGVIASGLEAAALREEVGDKLYIVTPGIRPADARAADDQKRVVTPEDAFRNGADYIVVGRPIRDAADPRAAAEAIQAQIATML